jgi:hypothetical protein
MTAAETDFRAASHSDYWLIADRNTLLKPQLAVQAPSFP